ncbi:MAG: polysaccharide biosynthesis tyrosine autokinase [Nitrospirae bacterium]|nr:polysaccharide biosynthesis tyrosine autokinase [Nitrospirota bacterium]
MELKRFLDILWRRRLTAVVVFLFFFLTITILTFVITPWYDSSARVMLKKTSATASLNLSMGFASDLLQFTDTERADYLAFATIRPIVQEVIDKLHLRRERLRYKITRLVPSTKVIFKRLGLDVQETQKDMTAEELVEASLVSLVFPRPHLKVKQHEDTNVYIITATSTKPTEAKEIANTAAAAISDAESKRIKDGFKEAKGIIDTFIGEVRADYLQKLKTIKDFQNKENAISIDSQVSSILENLAAWKKNLYTARLAILKTDAAIKRVQEQLKGAQGKQGESNSLVTSDMLTNFQQKLTALYLSMAEAKTKYTNNHPSVVDIDNQITQIKEMLNKELEKALDTEKLGLESVYVDARKKLVEHYVDKALNESQYAAYPEIIKKYEDELKSMSDKNYTFTILKLDATVTEMLYKTLQQYQYQIGLAQNVAMSNFSIIEPAIVHTSSKHRHPSVLLNIVLAFVLGSVLGIVAVLFMQYMDDTVATAEDVKDFKTLPLVGVLPCVKAKKKDIELSPKLLQPLLTVVNSITYLHRTPPTVPPSDKEANNSVGSSAKTIIITSALKGEGKSFITSNIARAMVAIDKKVLLIDGAGTSSKLHAYFGVSMEQGLSDYLPVLPSDMRAEDLENAPVFQSVEGVDLLTAGTVPVDNALSIHLDRFNRLITLFESFYDYVIIDTPAASFSDDAMLLSGANRMVMLVIESARCPRHIIEDVLVNQRASGTALVVSVLNKYNVKSLYNKYYSTHRYLPQYRRGCVSPPQT